MPQPPSWRFVDIPSRLLQERPRFTKRANRLLQAPGPGLIPGASDDDPSGIGTYSQAGAQLGFGISWPMLLTYPLMVAIQEISARVGRTTGRGIAGNICRHYPNSLLRILVAMLFSSKGNQYRRRSRREGRRPKKVNPWFGPKR